MTVVVTETTGTRAIVLRGEITEAELATLRACLVTALWRERRPELIVHFGRDAVVDPATVGTLLAAAGIADDHHLDLRFHCDDPATARQLHLAGLDTTSVRVRT